MALVIAHAGFIVSFFNFLWSRCVGANGFLNHCEKSIGIFTNKTAVNQKGSHTGSFEEAFQN